MIGQTTIGDDFVDHRYIEEADITDRYLLGKLAPEEQDRFEEHFVDCLECLDRLETTKAFSRSLKIAVAEDTEQSRSYVGIGFLAWLMRRSRWQQALLVFAAVLLPSAVVTSYFISKIRRVQDQLEQSKKTSSDWQRRYEDQRQSASRLEKELQDANANLTERRRELETRSGERRELASSSTFQVQIPVFPLSIVRGSDPSSGPTSRISIPQSARSIVLSLELENDSRIRSYRATITNAGQHVIWTGSNLKRRSKDTLRIHLSSDLVEPGDYQLTLEGLTRERNYIHEGKYGFRVSKAK